MLMKLTAGRSSVKDGREGVSGVEGGHRQARWAHQWQVQHAVLVNNFFNHPNFFEELCTLSYFQTAHILKRQLAGFLTNRGSGICNCIFCLIEGFHFSTGNFEKIWNPVPTYFSDQLKNP